MGAPHEILRSRSALAAGNLFLRKQLALLVAKPDAFIR